MSAAGSSKRLYTRVPHGLSKMTDAQIDEWAGQVFDQLMSVVDVNLQEDDEIEDKEAPMNLPIYLSDPDFFATWSLGDDHPTQGRRYSNTKKIFGQLVANTALEVVEIAPRQATHSELLTVHSAEHVRQVTEHFIRFPASEPDSEQATLASAMVGATLQMLDALISKKTRTAINFAGAKHHAQYDHSSGFCVFNDFAIAATIASHEHGLKVAILDIDGHHGDGTEELTRENPSVLTYSVHHFGIFPGTGKTSDAANLVFNAPLANGDGDDKLVEATEEFLGLVKDFQPDLVFIAAGADGHETDPLTGLTYSVDGYVECARILRESLPSMPILIGGAGGYQPDDITPEIWAKFAIQIAQDEEELPTNESELI